METLVPLKATEPQPCDTQRPAWRATQAVFSEDLDKNVVDFMPNFDETEGADVVVNCIPNLPCNGADGIAVGMATSIPPHNLGEVMP